MEQERLFRLAYEAVGINAHREIHGYWSVNIRLKRADEAWDECFQDTYSLVTTEELVQLFDDVVAPRLLGS
jgi:hypothetical protein